MADDILKNILENMTKSDKLTKLKKAQDYIPQSSEEILGLDPQRAKDYIKKIPSTSTIASGADDITKVVDPDALDELRKKVSDYIPQTSEEMLGLDPQRARDYAKKIPSAPSSIPNVSKFSKLKGMLPSIAKGAGKFLGPAAAALGGEVLFAEELGDEREKAFEDEQLEISKQQRMKSRMEEAGGLAGSNLTPEEMKKILERSR